MFESYNVTDSEYDNRVYPKVKPKPFNPSCMCVLCGRHTSRLIDGKCRYCHNRVKGKNHDQSRARSDKKSHVLNKSYR